MSDEIATMEAELKSLKQKICELEYNLANAILQAKQDQAKQDHEKEKNKEKEERYKGPLKSYMNKRTCFDEKEYTLFELAFYQVDEPTDYKRYDYVRRKMPEILVKIRETIKQRCPYIKSIGNACECGAFCQNMPVPVSKVYECSESLRNLIIEVKEGDNILGNWILFQKVLF